MKIRVLHALLAASVLVASFVSETASAKAAALNTSSFTWGNWNTSVGAKQSLNAAPDSFQALFSTFNQIAKGTSIGPIASEGAAVNGSKVFTLDASNLKLKNSSVVNTFFINEGAGYRNQLAFNASNGSSSKKGLIFEDVSSKNSVMPNSDGPLKLGDWVSSVTSTLELNLTSGYEPTAKTVAKTCLAVLPMGRATPTAKLNYNQDGLQHVVAQVFDKRYILLGFEDLYGAKGASGKDAKGIANERSDRDFNDTVFVIDAGRNNIVGVPEPSATVAMLGLGIFGLMSLRRCKPVIR